MKLNLRALHAQRRGLAGLTRHTRRAVLAGSTASLLSILALLMPAGAHAGGGPIGIDYEWTRSDTGIWARKNQIILEDGTVVFEAAAALWLGNDNPLGHTFWQSADSMVFSGLSAQVLKFAFSRARPTQGGNPNKWFQGHGDQSFPSGEVTEQASFVTPFIIDYVRTDPWVAALEALPVYDAIGRMKSQGHWQTDVIAGWLLGTGFGYWATTRQTPLLVGILPGGLSVGFSKHF